MHTTKELTDIATQVRRDIIRMVNSAKSGHPGGSLGCADFLTALYFEIMEINPEKFQINDNGEDLFFLSNGHITPVFYSVLAHRGYFPVSELATFRKMGSRLQGHPSISHNLPGVRMASGSLGQGISNALGAALAKKMNGDKHLVYVLCGDGELNEGQNWEAALFGPARGIDNLILTIDANGQQIDGKTCDVLDLGNLKAKFESFDWLVLEMDGHHFDSILETMKKAKSMTGKGKPIAIVMKTDMGHGVDFMAGTHKWHGVAPNDEQTQKALEQLPVTLGDY